MRWRRRSPSKNTSPPGGIRSAPGMASTPLSLVCNWYSSRQDDSIDDPEQSRVAPAAVVRGVVVPADVIARARVEIERVGMRIVRRRELQRLAGNALEPMQSGPASDTTRRWRCQAVDGAAADAASLLMARQVSDSPRSATASTAAIRLRSDICRQEFRQEQEGSLRAVMPTLFGSSRTASRSAIDRSAARSHPAAASVTSVPPLAAPAGRRARRIVDHHPNGEQRGADGAAIRKRMIPCTGLPREQIEHVLRLEAADRGLPDSRLTRLSSTRMRSRKISATAAPAAAPSTTGGM